ncbi:MAG: hypothetical protein OXR72_05025 [Gemmatimonadota bacterium]|nr:hypothetical protein [Gemmatimonadota bacterium]
MKPPERFPPDDPREWLNSCANDAYFLDCALRHGAPLLTLDRTLSRAAAALGVNTVVPEV